MSNSQAERVLKQKQLFEGFFKKGISQNSQENICAEISYLIIWKKFL